MGTLYYGDNLDKAIERPSNVAALGETFKQAPESREKHGHRKDLGL